jgi:hypothetical protein
MGTGGLTDKQERAVLLIINTADYCSQTTNQLVRHFPPSPSPLSLCWSIC